MEKVWLIDSGHGGLIDGVYQTAPAKMYDHGGDNIFYEGASNRDFAEALMDELYKRGIKYINITGTELDLPLKVRVSIINTLYKEYPNAVLLSIHSNAGKGRGLEVWTSKGNTRSDVYGELLSKELKFSFPDIKFRPDLSDGDLDKEAAFYILKYSNCPAVLPECLFYDNWEDYRLLVSPTFRKDYVSALVRWIEKCNKMSI